MADTDILSHADIAIIGGGIMGASIAFQLTKESDAKVVLIEQFPPVGGMSGRTFGQIRQHYSNELMVKLAIRGFDILRDWSQEVAFGDPGYVRMGYLLLVVDEQLTALKGNVALGQRLGVDTRLVGPEEIKAIEPALTTDDLAGGVYEPDGGYIDVTRMVLSWLGAAESRGLNLMAGLRANAIETSNGKVKGVRTTEGLVEVPLVVNATGAWGRDLLSPIGIDIPIERRRLDMAYMRQPPNRAQIGTCITDGNSNVVIRPDMGRDILVAAYPREMPLVEDPCAPAPLQDEESHQERIAKAFAERLPDFRDAKVSCTVSGAYDVTPDFHPILGWAPGVEGLYLAMGFSGHGLKLSPGVGETVAAMVLGKEPPFDVKPLRFERFTENEPMYLAYGPSARA